MELAVDFRLKTLKANLLFPEPKNQYSFILKKPRIL